MRALLAMLIVTAACEVERERPDDPCPGASVHGCGILDETSAEFHGREVERLGWDLGICADCHGGDFGGGAAGKACTTCHEDGPDACDTCHEAVPTTGAHTAHVGGDSAGLACAACHQVPARWDDEGHVRRAGRADPAPVEVIMEGLAAVTVVPADRAGPPQFEAGTCRNVYCHGDVLGDAGAATPEPSWTADPPGPAPCGSCHGAPPPSHAVADCATCHPGAGEGAHLDGVTDVGRAPGGCSGCHGTADSPAPPRDLAGNVFTSAIGVGAHQAHLRGTSGIAAPVACGACHTVPAEVTSPGHLDGVGPAEVVAALGWDRGTATCASAWCHGDAAPRWTVAGDAACGTCHGVPPAGAPHTPAMTLADCHGCHPSTIDTLGGLIGGPGSTHIDGVIDAAP